MADTTWEDEPRSGILAHSHVLYRCFRRVLDSLIEGAAFFFAAVPLDLFVDSQQKGPHFFPANDQNTALLVSILSLMMLFWAWQMNRCFAAIDLARGFSPTDSNLKHLPLAFLVVAVPFISYILNLRSRSAAKEFDAFHFDDFSVVIYRDVEFHLQIHEQTSGRVNTKNLFIISRLAFIFLAYTAARVLWDGLTVRSLVARFSP